MEYIHKLLAKEIREKVESLRDTSLQDIIFRSDIINICSLVRERNVRKAILRNAQIHSFRMEYPELQVGHSIPRNKRKRGIRVGTRKIESAFNFGRLMFDPNSFEESFIREIAGRISPELYGGKIAEYRDCGVRVIGARVTPPDSYKAKNFEIPRFVFSLKNQLSRGDVINIMESAIYAHLHIARIHPFVDGNGRTARTLQDVILHCNNIPLPIIEVGERDTYYSILDRAVYDWKHIKNAGELVHGATRGESDFYTFIAGKINVSLDRLIDSTK